MKKIEQIYGVKTAYITEGEGPDMILLHGWGQNKEMIFLALVRVIIRQLLGAFLIMRHS